MKLIQCLIRQQKLNDVVDKLVTVTTGLTVSEVRSQDCNGGHPIVYRGVKYQLTLLPKFRIEILTDDNKVDDLIKILTETARTGEIGDGRICVLPVDETYHVRTGFLD